MKRTLRVMTVALAAAIGLPATARAGSEVDALLNKLVDKGLLTSVEAQEVRNEIGGGAKDREDQQKSFVKDTAKDVVPKWAQNIALNGDMRLREEYRNRTGTGQDINRQRIRFRYGLDAKVADDLKVGARFATGSTTDPVSTNQSLNTAFNHKNFLLDRAFVEYTPEVLGISKLKLSGGIIENPFWMVGPLVWDDDLNFDGAAVHVDKQLGPVTVFTNDGLFSLQTDVSEAASLWSLQGGVSVTPFANEGDEILKNLKLTAALAYHDYKNVTDAFTENDAFAQAGGASGTTPAAPSSAQLKGNTSGVRDFNLLNSTVELASQYDDVPFSLFGDWVHNTAVHAGDDGFMIGVKAGKARVPFDLLKGWEGGYYFERLAPDATFGPFTDSDFCNGGTNHLGHVYWLKFATLKNSAIQLKYFNTQEIKGAKNHADTFQADWVTKF